MNAIVTTPNILRPLRRGDLDELVRGLNNFAVSQWTARVPFPYTRSDAEDFLAISGMLEAGTLRLSILREGQLIGGIGYERTAGGASAEIGYWLAEAHWGRGYGREAARAMADHAFEISGHAGMDARYRHGNEASRRILEGLGFAKTGDAMMFSKAAGTETPVTHLKLERAAWRQAKSRRS